MDIDRRMLLLGSLGIPFGCADACARHPRMGEAGTLFPPGNAAALPRVHFTTAPEWLRWAGGLYCPAPRTAGSALLQFADPKHALSQQIQSFRQLPELLANARTLGTDILYLVDWYEGRSDLDPTNYCWNKGDYLVRSDLGGEEAFIDGIAAVHAQGGRVLLYLEPFVVEKGSALGRTEAERWAIRTAEGFPEEPYPDAWKMCPACAPWVEHLASVAARVTERYGADGLHLDSFGYQRGWSCVETSHGHAPGDPEVFEAGCKSLVERLHREITMRRPDAAIMTEGPKLPGLFRWASASQEWGIGVLSQRWVWKAAGQVAVFTSGWNIEDLYQIVALGHRISLGADYWLTAPTETLAQTLARLVPDGNVAVKRDERFRRFFAEDWFRAMHQHRNSRLLAGLAVPNIDHAAPRRWDRPEAFESQAALEAIIAQGSALREAVEAGPRPLAPTERVRALVTARRTLAPMLDGSVLSVLPSPSATAAGYRHEGPRGTAVMWVNAGIEPVDIELPRGTRWREHIYGEDSGGGHTSLPAHDLRCYSAS